jgi:hypothetical protein
MKATRELLLVAGVLGQVALILVFYSLYSGPSEASLTPQQVHLSFSKIAGMTVTWSLKTPAEECSVFLYEGQKLVLTVTKQQSSLLLEGDNSNYIYSAELTGLKPGSRYDYTISCSSDGQTSYKHYDFMSHPGYIDQVSLLILGDWATSSFSELSDKYTRTPKPHILDALLKEEAYSSIWHLGDLAYDLHTDNGRRGDQFLRDIEPLVARVPYMVVPGNHEFKRRFKHLSARFRMPTPKHKNLFYSMQIGKAYVIVVNTELGKWSLTNLREAEWVLKKQRSQHSWLGKELTKANKLRALFPWVIVMGHKPLYCAPNEASKMIRKVCGRQAPEIRREFEGLFMEHKVDLYLAGHVHLYERMLPVYNWTVVGDFNDTRVLVQPQAPVYIINGVAGNLEDEQVIFNVTDTPNDFTVAMSESLGYGKLHVINSTHLRYEQLAFGRTQFDGVDELLWTTRRIEDEFWIVKANYSTLEADL